MKEFKEYFSNHILTKILETDNLSIFEFRNENNSNIHYQRWILDYNKLIVTGDCYSSIYEFSSRISIPFLANCDINYFNSKCRADRNGWEQKIFDPTECEKYLKELACNNIGDYLNLDKDFDGLTIDEKFNIIKPTIKRKLDIDEYNLEYLFYFDRVQDAYDFLTEPKNEFMFGSDAWEMGCGLEILSSTPKIHLMGIKCAFEKNADMFA